MCERGIKKENVRRKNKTVMEKKEEMKEKDLECKGQ